MKSRQFVLAARPTGSPTLANFALESIDLPDLGPGQVLVRNEVLSVDPYMRPRMDDRPSYIAPFPLGEPLTGGAVGRVVESADLTRPVGSLVRHMSGWRDLALVSARDTELLAESELPSSYHLGILGMPGLTAFAGLKELANIGPADTLFVSGAAGAVGGLVGQFGRLMGADQVIGSAGTDEKARLVVENLGFDTCFNYRSAPVGTLLTKACPDGVDVYFDNVGGDHLGAAIEHMRMNGRIVMCGVIADYDTAPEDRVLRTDVFQIIAKRVSLRGFISTDHAHLRPEFFQTVAGWLRDDRITYHETVTEGLENTPTAFINMLSGGNIGKAVVHV